MKKAVLVGMLCMLAFSARVPAEEPLTPRYSRIIGVEFRPFGWAIFGHECTDADGKEIKYRGDSTVRGLIVANARPGTPAADAGIRCGDLILAADDQEVNEIRELRGILNGDARKVSVRLTISRPVQVSADAEGIIVRYPDRFDVVLNTVALDNIAELKTLPPLTRELAFDDGFGKPFLLRSTSAFAEVPGDQVRYSCTLSHEGEQEKVLLESAYFAAFGSLELLPSIGRGEHKAFVIMAPAASGIPTPVMIPMRVDRDLDIKKVQLYLREKGGGAGLNDEGQAGDRWHAWVPFEPECWLPESVARLVEIKRKRGF